jgi:uncharacterized protein
VLALFVGLVIGLVFSVLGAGGGIVSVPVFLIIFSLSLADATAAGLAVVFAAALASTVGHARARRVVWRTVLVLGPASMLGAVVGARLNPLVPERVTAGLFAGLLLVATASLFRTRKDLPRAASLPILMAVGLVLGVLTGFLGVGGGFLLVPALVGLAGLSLPQAVGTSAALISLSSFAGGVTTIVARPQLATLVLPLAVGAVVGAVLGVPLSGRLPERALKFGFAGLSVAVAVGMGLRALG